MAAKKFFGMANFWNDEGRIEEWILLKKSIRFDNIPSFVNRHSLPILRWNIQASNLISGGI